MATGVLEYFSRMHYIELTIACNLKNMFTVFYIHSAYIVTGTTVAHHALAYSWYVHVLVCV